MDLNTYFAIDRVHGAVLLENCLFVMRNIFIERMKGAAGTRVCSKNDEI